MGLPVFQLIVSLALLLVWYEDILATAKSDFEFSWDSCDCHTENSSRLLSLGTCSLGKSKKRPRLNIEMMYTEDVYPLYFNVLIVMPRKSGNFVLLNVTKANTCDFQANKNQVGLLKMIRNLFNKYSNFPKECPYRKDVLYYIRNFRIDVIPAMAFESVYNVHFESIVDAKTIFQGSLQGSIVLKEKRMGQ